MGARHFLDLPSLASASRGLAATPGISDRLAWWLQHGHACEGWVRFEWAFQLQKVVGESFAVLAEHRRVDVTLVPWSPSGEPLWHSDPAARIEIKWYGNWYIDAFEGLRVDIQKVLAFDVPAVAVLLFLVVDVDPMAAAHAWVGRQISRGVGRPDWDGVRSALTRATDQPFLESVASILPAFPLRSIDLHTVVFHNQFYASGP